MRLKREGQFPPNLLRLLEFGLYPRERIDHYLAAATIDDLYERVLSRYEEDYERERPGLVGEAMSLLWAARRGLSETELLNLPAPTNNSGASRTE